MKDNSPTRRLWQFSLKGLLILMLIVAGYCAGWATAIRLVRQAEHRAREEAIRALQMADEARMQAERAAAAFALTKANAAMHAAKTAKAQKTIDLGQTGGAATRDIEKATEFTAERWKRSSV